MSKKLFKTLFKNFVVSGGTGFIGSALVEKLVGGDGGCGRANVVRVLTTNSPVKLPTELKNVEYRKADITKKETLKGVFSGSDCFFHFAALIPKSGKKTSLAEYMNVNANGTLNLMEECVKSGVKCVVFASTHEVYGKPKYVPVDERHPLISFLETVGEKEKKDLKNERLFYAASKISAEKHVLSLSDQHGLKGYVLRFSNVFGPKASQEGAIINFIKNVSNGKPPTVFGDGAQQRDYIFVDDAVRASLMTADKPPGSKIFNIGNGKGSKIIDIANYTIEVYKKYFHKAEKIKPIFKQSGKEFSKYLDISLARREIGFKPTVDLKDGIRKTVFWYESAKQKEK